MLDRDEGCTDVLTQIASARAALSAVGFGLVDCEVLAAVSLLVRG